MSGVAALKLGSGRYRAAYPSGTRLDLDGDLLLLDLDENGITPAVDNDRGMFVLDPRAVVRDRDTSTTAYHPRDTVPAGRMAPWAVEWLGEHLAWAVVR